MTPTKYASAAAIEPTKSVVKPECNHDDVDHLLFMEPIAKKTIPVRITDNLNDCSTSNK